MTTFTYTKPTVGGSEDTWGDTLNANWDAIAAFIGPLDSTELALLDGATIALADITATANELNLLDGVPLTTDLSYVDGVTSAIQDQIDNIPTPPELTQVQAEDDTSTVFGQVSGERLAQAAVANLSQSFSESLGGFDSNGYIKFPNGLIIQWGRVLVLQGSSSIVALPIAFTTAHIGGQATINETGAESPGGYGVYYDNTSLTQCRVVLDGIDGPTGSRQIYFLAIGH
jgi:hypothetical protein